MDNLFQQLHDALQDFKDFLDAHVADVDGAFDALAALIPQIRDFITTLIDLLNKVKAEIAKYDIDQIPHAAEVVTFASSIGSVLTSVKTLLPNQAGAVTTVSDAVAVVAGIANLTDQLKTEINGLIDAIVGHLNTLKA